MPERGGTWLRRRLPLDGRGLRDPDDPVMAKLRSDAACSFWRRLPAPLRIVARVAARLWWRIEALRLTGAFIKRRGGTPWLLRDCLDSGAQPVEAFIWRGLFGECHPLPGRGAGVLLSRIGDPGAHRLTADKLAMAEVLAQQGLRVPAMRSVLAQGAAIDLSKTFWSVPTALFLKPRHGHAGKGAATLDIVAPERFRIEGLGLLDRGMLAAYLSAWTQADDLIIQERVLAHPDCADLVVSGRAPVLRLTTAREPNGPAFLHSAFLSIGVPGQNPRNFLRGHIRAPVSDDGVMWAGVMFQQPTERLSHLPWNGAPLVGRRLAHFDLAIDTALAAMTCVPGLALVNWDIILDETGPVLLEGNTVGDWILTNLSRALGLPAISLTSVLVRWGVQDRKARTIEGIRTLTPS